MTLKMITSAGFAAHVLLGNFCMMPMAMAEEMPMSHEDHAETIMTPMSSADCEHCLSESTPQASTAIQTSGFLGTIALPISIVSPFVSAQLNGLPHSTAPPGVPLSTRTIVLRC